jgi:tetratricopeptide (TPR) repeat protein
MGKSWTPAVLIALATGIVYANFLGNGFSIDDGDLIEKNPWIRDLGNVATFFASDYWEPALKAGLYRPITTLSYALNFAVSGGDPAGYRLLNLALHTLNAVLVWLLARRLVGSELVAAGAALLFATHAVHVEAVVGVSAGRPELLAACFFLAALLGHALRERKPGRPGKILLAGSLFLYGLALLSKESAVTLLGVLVLYDTIRASEREPRLGRRLAHVMRSRLTTTYAGYLAVTAVYLATRWLALRDGDALPPAIAMDNPLVELGFLPRTLSALDVAWRYVGMLVFPWKLSYDYSYDQIPLLHSLLEARSLLVLAATLALGWIWLRSFARSDRLGFALGFSFISFAIASNLIVPIGTIMGERLVYLPSVGFCLAAAIGLEALSQRLFRSRKQRDAAFGVAVAILVALHGWRAVDRNDDWSTMKRLYLHDLEVSPRSAKVHSNAAGILAHWGRYEEAMEHYQKAIEIRPHDYAHPHQGLGMLLVRLGERERAVAHLERTAEMAPRDPEVLWILATAYFESGRYRSAQDALQRSLELESASASGPKRRALLQQIEEALSHPGRPEGPP